MKQEIVFLFLILLPCIADANLDAMTWKGTYYQEKPIKKNVSLQYCKNHALGSFIHTVKDSKIITDKNILLTDSHFNIDKVNNIYLIHGDFLATSKLIQPTWQERIYYFLYKWSENGVTEGIWYTDKCKGLYKGVAINY